MLVFDELKKNDPQLRLVALLLAGGLFILLAGLWWVQIVSAREFQNHLETQSYRSVRMPAMRGKILDREGRVLAENRARYDLNLYLDELRAPFENEFGELKKAALAAQKQTIATTEKKLGRSLTKIERKNFAIKTEQWATLREDARDRVVAKIFAQLSQKLGQPISFNATDFNRHYAKALLLPYPILKNLDAAQIARFEENFSGRGADLELQTVRDYPQGTTAGHLLGYLTSDNDSQEGEDAFFNYRLTDYRGVVGIEGGFDAQLRGRAGAESVLVNNAGYRVSEIIGDQPAAGENVTLTIDLDLQRAAQDSLAAHQGPDARGAIVVMDVHSGDILALVSSPAINPDYAANNPARMADAILRMQHNRATQDNYAPGSIFKPVIGLAALEAGLNPENFYNVEADPLRPGRGCIYIGKRKIEDLAQPGEYDFRRAIMRSSNAYFITNGLQAGMDKILTLAEKFHFGEKTGLPTEQETRGVLPSREHIHDGWRDGDTANFCIGQGDLSVTPLQMAVAYSAIANGGKVLWPRLVQRIEPSASAGDEITTNFPSGLVRDELGVSAHSLNILHNAMLAETEDPLGTGNQAAVAGLRICGKTGTAQVMNERNQVIDDTTWFASFAPYENPRYAVVVMVESGISGGSTCAPIAHDIYQEILRKMNASADKNLAMKNTKLISEIK
jgi:penicillin-binding protein 2